MNINSGYDKTHSANNFDFLRLIAAIMVVISHSYALLLLSSNEPFIILSGIDLGELGVIVFFVISGFLITKSWHKRPLIINYFWNRVLRIVPALIVLSLFTVFILGPITTSFSLVDYFMSGMTWNYFRIITVFGIFPHNPPLPGVFLNNPFPGAVNGSLWSLPLEFSMYMLVCLAGVAALLPKKRLLLIATACLAVTYLAFSIGDLHVLEYTIGLLGHSSLLHAMRALALTYLLYPIYFMIGAVFYLYSGRIKFDFRIALPLLVFWVISFKTILFLPVSMLSLPYGILCFANTGIPYINGAGKYGDFSYGLYIYAWPVQQAIIHFIKGIDVYELIALTLVIAGSLAILSWNLVESRALELKKVEPGVLLVKIRNAIPRF